MVGALGGHLAGAVAVVAGYMADMAWEPLRMPTFWLVRSLLEAMGEEVVCRLSDFELGTKDFSVIIASSCSGYAGIGLMFVFMGVFFWSFRSKLRFPRAFLLLPLAILAIWFVNAWRIALLVMFGTHISPQIALGGFHSILGWLLFIGVGLVIVAVTQRMAFFALTEAGAEEEERKGKPVAGYLAPLMTILALNMVTAAFFSGLDWLYPVRVLATGIVIWHFWRGTVSGQDLVRIWSWGPILIGGAVFLIWTGLESLGGETEKSHSIRRCSRISAGRRSGGLAALPGNGFRGNCSHC